MTKAIKSLIDPTFPFASSGSENAGQLETDFEPTFQAWKANDTPATRGALLKQVQPVLNTALYSYAGAGASPAIKSRAKLLALQAFKSYDPNKGAMKSHLLSQLRRLQRDAAQGNQIISMPERVSMDRMHLMESEKSLRDQLGRDPSDLEVADHTGLSLKRLGYIRNATSGINTGSIMDADGEVFSPASKIPGATDADDAWADMIYYDLGDVDRAIMDYTLGLRGVGQLSTNDLAARLNLSPGAISQRKAKIQALLDQKYEISPFGAANA